MTIMGSLSTSGRLKVAMYAGVAALCMTMPTGVAAQVSGGGIAGGTAKAGLGQAACTIAKDERVAGAISAGVMPSQTGVVGEALNSALGEGVNAVKGIFGGNVSPFCNVDTPQAALLLTGEMIDEATLSSAEALVIAAEGLDLKTSLKADVQTMREARGDFSPLDDDGAHKKTTKRIGSAAVEVAKKLATLQAQGGLTPELREVVVEVSQKLSEATWFQIQSGVGVSAVKTQLGGVSQQQGGQLIQDQNVGLNSEFAQNLPGRMQNILANTGKLLALQAAVSKLADPDLEEDLKKADKQGKKSAKKIAKQRAKEANQPRAIDWGVSG